MADMSATMMAKKKSAMKKRKTYHKDFSVGGTATMLAKKGRGKAKKHKDFSAGIATMLAKKKRGKTVRSVNKAPLGGLGMGYKSSKGMKGSKIYHKDTSSYTDVASASGLMMKKKSKSSGRLHKYMASLKKKKSKGR